jgi:methyl-accepting chemotaxis protein
MTERLPRALLAELPLPVCATDAAGNVVTWSPALAALLARSADDVLGQPAWLALYGFERPTAVEDAIETRETCSDPNFVVFDASGKERIFRLTVSPVVSDGAVAGTWLTFTAEDSADESLEFADELVRVSVAVRGGDVDARGEPRRFSGPWQRLMTVVNETIDALVAPANAARATLERLAAYDLRARMEGEFQGKHGELQTALNATAGALQTALCEVAGSVERVAEAAVTIAASGQSQASGAHEHAEAARGAGTSLRGAAASSRDGVRKAREALTFASSIGSLVETGRRSLAEMRAVLKVMHAAIEGTGCVVESVRTGASSTDELAATASAEAARVGASGRGFAVVADEVRRLSRSCTKAADAINAAVAADAVGGNGIATVGSELREIALHSNLLALNAAVEAAHVDAAAKGFGVVVGRVKKLSVESRDASQRAVTQMGEAVESAERGDAAFEAAERPMTAIVDGAGRMAELVREIAAKIEQQAATIATAQQAVETMERLAQENIQAAEGAKATGAQLDALTATLRALVQRFQLQ